MESDIMSYEKDSHVLTGEQSKRYGKARDNYDRLIADPEYRKDQKETRTVAQIKKIRAGLEERLAQSTIGDSRKHDAK
jgi:hypothetical protein